MRGVVLSSEPRVRVVCAHRRFESTRNFSLSRFSLSRPSSAVPLVTPWQIVIRSLEVRHVVACSGIARAVLLDSSPLDLPEASVERFHELLLGDDAALARYGLIVFFVLRHLYHLLFGTVPAPPA